VRGRWEKVAARRAWQPVDQAELDRPESDADPEHLSFGRHVLVFFKELAAVVLAPSSLPHCYAGLLARCS